MRRQRGLVGLTGLVALVGIGIIAKPAMATVTTERSSSILVYPKVIANGTRDTIIQITNTSNNMVHAHCFYVNGAPSSPGRGPLCLETDFDIWLTKQQPTFWTVSKGRRASFTLPVAGVYYPGFSGLIPPVAPDFVGELKCIQVDGSGAPLSGNALKGEATLETIATGDVSKYNAVGIHGWETNDQNSVLCLGSETASASACPLGREYDGCPLGWFLDHPATASVTDPVAFSVGTNLTVVPCTENFETQAPTSVTLQFLVTNEYEQTLSTSTTVSCWASWDLGLSSTDTFLRVFDANIIGGSIVLSRLRSASGSKVGVIPVIEETRTLGGVTAKSAQNGHVTPQDQPGMDLITVPFDQGQVIQ